MIALPVLAGAIAALAAGAIAPRWRVVPFVGVLGIAIITIDVTTRDMINGGHDDRGLVAVTELTMLVGTLVLVASGIALRRWRDRHRGRPARQSGSHHA